MTREDPTRTVHHLVARTIALRAADRHGSERIKQTPESLTRKALQDTDPHERQMYLLFAEIGWLVLGSWVAIAMAVTGFATREWLGDQAARIVVSVWAVPCFFCVAGAFNVVWRYYWYAPQARRRARRDGVDSERFAVSMRRTLPTRGSAVWMAVVGLAAAVITYLVW